MGSTSKTRECELKFWNRWSSFWENVDGQLEGQNRLTDLAHMCILEYFGAMPA